MDRVDVHPDKVVVKVKSADQTVNNSTTVVSITGLGLPVKAGEKWIVDYYIFYNSSAVADIRWQFSVSGASSDLKWYIGSSTQTSNGPTLLTKLNASSSSATGTGEQAQVIRAFLNDIQDDGDYEIQFAQLVAEASDTKVLADSYAVYRRVS